MSTKRVRKERRKLRRCIKGLEQFNRNIDDLLKESEFIKWISNNKLGYSILYKDKTEKYYYPSKDAFKAFILTYRFFIQDNEQISLRNMKKLYDNLPIPMSKKKDFYAVRDHINKYLDSKPMSTISGFGMTSNREMQNVILYGGYVHRNKKYIKKFDQWIKEKTLWKMIFIDFCATLFYIFKGLVIIKKINEDTINEIRKYL